MIIDKYTVASIAYTMTTDNNRKIIEIIRSNHPKSFFFGAGTLLPSFEEHLNGLREGDSFDFSLSAEEAYGPKDPFAIMEIPKDTFSIDGKIQENMFVIGNDIPMADDQGNKHMAVILELRADNLLMDFNHPLAGKIIRFRGEVKNVREATQEEIDSLASSCGSGGCTCKTESKEKDHQCDPEREAAGECCHGDDSKCGCKSEKEAAAQDSDCVVCGNPPEDQGKGIGDCKCI